MMLDEAIAKYQATIDGMHCFDPKECQMCAEDKCALDAAVRDVALAAANTAGRHSQWSDGKSRPIPCQGCDLCTTRAEIVRQFGLLEGSERGKDERTWVSNPIHGER